MKVRLLIFTLLLLGSTFSLAEDWQQAFRETYSSKGIDEAVVNALGTGASPDQIIKTGLPIEGLNPAELVKALFCALVPPAYIYDAAEVNRIEDETVQEGYELALAQCAEEMEERKLSSPAYLPGKQAAGIGGSGAIPPEPERPEPASPANFGR